MILAGDIGGTKTNLALLDDKDGDYYFIRQATYPSQKYTHLQEIVIEFLAGSAHLYDTTAQLAACFAIAGPVVDGVCHTTNLPWVVDARSLSQVLGIQQVYLLNDLEANAWAIEILTPESLYELYPGSGIRVGNRAVVSPGTGLGEAGIYWDGTRYLPFACEGGHCEFGPRNEVQIDLCRYIYRKFGHASYERVLSGPGLVNIYHFFKEELGRAEPAWLKEALLMDDPAKVITQCALNKSSELCDDVLNLFVSILGAESSNTVLEFMATGGVYLGGGIPPKILPKLKEPLFYAGFVDKGRFGSFLEAVPIRVILDDKASLKGAAHYCRLKMLSPHPLKS